MEPLIHNLNPSQLEAATTIDQHVRIIAGAGSGKTRVLMARIEYLINEIGIQPSRILAITFTNKAANEMRQRLQAQIGEEARQVRISTIHALCVRILREDAPLLGYPKSFAILDTDDQKSLLKPIYKKLEIDKNEFPIQEILHYISDHKTRDVSADQAAGQAYSRHEETRAELYKQYEQKKKEILSMDFDDLLINAERLLRTERSVREKWQNRLDYLHVDEFQDVDPIQYEIVKHLTRSDAILCVVGDPDQTIYTWRGAAVDIILHFDEDFAPCKTVILEENYRSAKPILEASNAVIALNRNRIKKDLKATVPGEELITLHESLEEDDEPIYVTRQIVELHEKGIPYEDIAILYRSNYLSRGFEKALRLSGIPYRIFGGIRFYDRAEIKDILSYLRLLCQPTEDDPTQKSLDLAVLRIINQPRRGIGARTIEKIQDEANKQDVNMLEVMKHPEVLTTAAARKASNFVELIEDLKEERKRNSLEDLIDIVLSQTGYRDMLIEAKEDERLDNVLELKNDIAQARLEDPDLTLESYLENIALLTNHEDNSNEGVTLMTAHAAKGTEFPVVFLVSFNEDIFPSAKSIQDGGNRALEEERRLLYVAMTRAKQRLFITWNKGYSFMLQKGKGASRFLKEIPKEQTYPLVSEQPSHPPRVNKPNSSITLNHPNRRRRLTTPHAHFHKGDVIEHAVYGEGVVLDIIDDVAQIAFGHTIGVKRIKATHPSIHKKGAAKN